MSPDAWLTLLVLAGAVGLFVSEKVPVDVVALLVLLSLLVLGLVGMDEALSGFASPATLTVAAMFVLSAGVQRSGALRTLAHWLARMRWRWLFALVMMLMVALISAFINNTAAVAVFLPLVIAATTANGWAPSRFLIPLSFAAQFGGVCTLLGTSTNLLIDSMARDAGVRGFGLFEFAPLGILFVAVGTVYLMAARRWLLPDLGVPEQDRDEHVGQFLAELLVLDDSRVVGMPAGTVAGADGPEVLLLEVLRDGRTLGSPYATVLEPGDRLLLRGLWSEIEAVRRQHRLGWDRVAADLDGNPHAPRLHVQAMVSPGSHLLGKTLSGIRFGHTYRARVHGLHRRRAGARGPIDKIPLAVGDVLLVDAPEKAIEELQADRGLIVLRQQAQPRVDVGRALTSLGVLAAVIAVAALGWLPIVAAALLGCVALVLLRCLKPEDAYAAIDWRVIILLAGVLPMGLALQKSGGADWVANEAMALIGPLGPTVTLSAIYLLTAMLTEAMSNNAAAVLVVPIALSTAEALGVDPRPFLVAVAFAASTSFATPVGYQTNTMVYAAGGYRFADFARIGVPLNVVFWIMATLLIPRYFPF